MYTAKSILTGSLLAFAACHAAAQSPSFWGVRFYQDDVDGLRRLAAHKGATLLPSNEQSILEYVGTFDDKPNVRLRFFTLLQNVRDRNSATGTSVYAGSATFDSLSRANADQLITAYHAKLSAKYPAPDFAIDTLTNRYDDLIIYTWRKADGGYDVVRRIFDKPQGDRRQVVIGCINNKMYDVPPVASAKGSEADAMVTDY